MARTKKRELDFDALERLSDEDALKYIQQDGKLWFASSLETVARLPTEYSTIDTLLGGGFPRGRITEIFGPESSSKTVLTLGLVATTQRNGGRVAWIDAERSYDKLWGELNGVDNSSLFMAIPDDGDEGYELVKTLVGSGKFDLVVVDSVANMVPRAELVGAIGDAQVGLHARLNGSAMRQLSTLLSKRLRTALVLINQIRSNVNTTGMGPQTSTTGGRAIPFYASLRLGLRQMQFLKQGEENTVGGEFQALVKKAKITGIKAQSKALFRVDFDHGLDYAFDILDQAEEAGLVIKSGAWYSDKDGNRLGQGVETAKKTIRENMAQWRSRLAELQSS